MRWKALNMAGIGLLVVAATAMAHAAPVYGPQTFERTTGESDTYADTFESPVERPFVLHVRNGDGEGSRVSSASVTLNGTEVVRPSDLSEEVPGLAREVQVRAGANEIEVILNGAPGSFLTLAIVPSGEAPVFVMGRLLLPWGRDDGQATLGIALKNGSHRFARAVRVVFFDPRGQVVAVSGRLVLPPRASLASAVRDLTAEGDWPAGSVEVFYAGRGTARLFGSARQADLVLDSSEVQTLSQAGYRVFRGQHPPRGALNRRSPRP